MHLRFACLAAILAGLSCSQAIAVRPSIVLILIDDLGYADIGAYGSKRNLTPHLEPHSSSRPKGTEGPQIAGFHSDGPMCSPTRAPQMTGLYPQRFGEQFESALSGIDEYHISLPLQAVSIARTLAAEGYATICPKLFGR